MRFAAAMRPAVSATASLTSPTWASIAERVALPTALRLMARKASLGHPPQRVEQLFNGAAEVLLSFTRQLCEPIVDRHRNWREVVAVHADMEHAPVRAVVSSVNMPVQQRKLCVDGASFAVAFLVL